MSEEYSDKQIISGLTQLEMILQGAKVVKSALARHQEIQREIKGYENSKAAKQAELAALDQQKAEAEEKMKAARIKHNQTMAQLAEEAERKAALGRDLDRQIEAKKEEIERLGGVYVDKKKEKDAELQAEQKVLDRVRQEIDRLKKQFAA